MDTFELRDIARYVPLIDDEKRKNLQNALITERGEFCLFSCCRGVDVVFRWHGTACIINWMRPMDALASLGGSDLPVVNSTLRTELSLCPRCGASTPCKFFRGRIQKRRSRTYPEVLMI